MDELAGAFYEGTLDPAQWQRGMARLARFAGARGSVFTLEDLEAQRSTVLHHVGQPQEAVEAYHREFYRIAPMMTTAPTAGIGHWHDWLARNPRYRESAYYNEFLVPHGNHASMASVLWRDGQRFACIGLQRTADQGAFSGDDLRRLAPLTPHLGRATRMYFLTHRLREESRLRKAMLDQVSVPIFVTEADGRLVLANQAAEDACRSGAALSIAGGRLQCVAGDARLRFALRQAALPRGPVGSCLRLAAQAGQEPPLLVVAPLAADAAQCRPWQRPLALVLASRPAGARHALAGLLRSVFQLTGAEARVAECFATGLAIPEIAERFAIKEQTVRGQLKSMFQKMGVRRQAELGRLLTELQALVPYARQSPPD